MAQRADPAGPIPAGADPDDYDRLRRRVLWSLPMGLYLLGSAAGERKNLMTLNWAMQAAVRPKLLAVSIEKTAVTHELVEQGGVFSLSLLSPEEKTLVRKFVKPAEYDPAGPSLNGVAVHTAVTGAPIPTVARSWLDCRVAHRLKLGSHTLFTGEVVAVGGGEPFQALRMEDTRMSYGG